ncbi:unnamed protein product [Trifolium pratense]|uniref:Uncharacterized protein n=1 Tax=Trifolium pratense TaxID=57577 RepID=A0ACB0IMC7_TRIPR|nr:unnamed protein product [Trifolium pratense]
MEASVFEKIWMSPAPSKIIAFSWQLLYDRLPSKSNLYRRGVMLDAGNQDCMWCAANLESGTHLLLHCDFAQTVWREVCKWLHLDIIIPPNLFVLFLWFYGASSNKKVRKGFLLIWHSTLWFLWKARNVRIFKNVIKVPREIVEEIKVMSWRWSVHRLKISPCLLYEWMQLPRYCFRR